MDGKWHMFTEHIRPTETSKSILESEEHIQFS